MDIIHDIFIPNATIRLSEVWVVARETCSSLHRKIISEHLTHLAERQDKAKTKREYSDWKNCMIP